MPVVIPAAAEALGGGAAAAEGGAAAGGAAGGGGASSMLSKFGPMAAFSMLRGGHSSAAAEPKATTADNIQGVSSHLNPAQFG